MKIKYRKGYKYQLDKLYIHSLPFKVDTRVDTDWCWIKTNIDGMQSLFIYRDYAWDGPSGPAVDTPSFMRASLVHDALYQLMREGKLPESYRKAADDLMRQICREDGMCWLRAWWCYRAVRRFAAKAARKGHTRSVITAP